MKRKIKRKKKVDKEKYANAGKARRGVTLRKKIHFFFLLLTIFTRVGRGGKAVSNETGERKFVKWPNGVEGKKRGDLKGGI